MIEFPAFLKLEHQAGNAAQSLLAEVDGALRPAQQRFAEFSQEAQAQLDRALSVKRNDSGALDLDVAGLRASANAMQARAIAAREVAEATALAAREVGDESQQARLARAATEALAVEYREAATAALAHADAAEQVQAVLNRTRSTTDLVIGATNRGTVANQSMINSQRAMRQAGIQSGQQLQDMVVQFEMGTRATTIFAQQVPQLAFALSGLEGSVNKTASRIGRFATFLSGPWGAAIFIGTAVLGPFIAKLFETEEASKAAELGANALAEAQSALGGIFDTTSGQIENQNELLRVNARLTAINLRADALAREQSSRTIFEDASSPNRSFFELQANEFGDVQARSEENARKVEGLLQLVQAGVIGMEQALSRTENIDLTGTGVSQQQLQQAIVDDVTARLNREAAGLIDQSLDSGVLATELRKPGRPDRPASNASAREAEQLADFAARAAEQIQRTNERFDEQPRLIDQAAQATRQLDDLIAELSERRPANFEQMVEDAREAQDVIQDALVRPYEELEEASNRRIQIQQLLVAGREDEADALQIIFGMEDKLGPITAARRADILDIVTAENEAVEAAQRQLDIRDAYVASTKQLRGELESLFAGEGFDPRRIARQLQARITVEAIFGDALREIEDVTRGSFDTTVDYLEVETNRAGQAAGNLADALNNAVLAINDPEYAELQRQFDANMGAANDNGDPNTITVTPQNRNGGTLNNMTPEAYFDLVGKRLVEPLVYGLEDVLGTTLGGAIGDALGGAAGAYLQSGPVGGALGLLRGLGVDGLDGAIGGAGQGAAVSGLLNSLGIKSSATGASIGGAVGAVSGIPGGQLIGSLAGGVIGKLGLGSREIGLLLGGGITYGLMHAFGIGGTKYGTAALTGSGAPSLSGTGQKRRDAAGTLGGSVQESLRSIADQLDADIGEFSVSIGTYKDNLRVSTDGRTGKLRKKFSDVTDFGEDEAAARAFAVANAIADGAIKGLNEAEQRLLAADKDLEAALQDVFDYRSVFVRLKEFKDPVGAAIDQVNGDFEDLIDLFERAGAGAEDLAKLEELYGIERANAIRDATEQMTGSLKDLLDELTIGDSGLSLRDRQANALGQYNDLAARVEGGDVTAFDEFSQVARELLAIEREMFGSQSGYFDRFDEVRGISQSALAQQQALIDNASNRDSPFGDNSAVVSAVDQQTNALATRLDRLLAVAEAQNDNAITVARLLAEANGSAAAGRNRQYADLYFNKSDPQ